MTHGFGKTRPAAYAPRRCKSSVSTREKNRSSRHFRGAWNTLVNFNDPIESTMVYIPGAVFHRRFCRQRRRRRQRRRLGLLIFAYTLLRCIRFAFWFDWFVAAAREWNSERGEIAATGYQRRSLGCSSNVSPFQIFAATPLPVLWRIDFSFLFRNFLFFLFFSF